MLGAAFGIWLADVKSRLNTRLWAWGMFGAAGFLLLCAAGSVLDAMHGWLAFRYGPVRASLIIAALLLVAAGGCALWATLLRHGRHHPVPASPLTMASLHPSRSAMRGLAVGGALSAVLAAYGLIRRYRRH
jgi:hypothetical protein